MEANQITVRVPAGTEPVRIDKYIARTLGHISRTKIQDYIRMGLISVNESVVVPSHKVRGGDIITIEFLESKTIDIELIPQNIPLHIIYEDDDIAVVNKPAGMPVHPGCGHPNGTLVNALLFHFKELSGREGIRPGLVHRLDIGTSGIIVVAKNDYAHNAIAKQFFERVVKKRYLALVWGVPRNPTGIINVPIERHPSIRTIMRCAVETGHGKEAITEYSLIESYYFVSLVECRPKTGRMHQIRVHMKYLGHPLFGDSDYGGDKILKGSKRGDYITFAQEVLAMASRPMLHALSLGFYHPRTQQWVEFTAQIPEDMLTVIEKWKTNYQKWI